MRTNKRAYRQTNRHTTRPDNKQKDKQTNGWTHNRQTSGETNTYQANQWTKRTTTNEKTDRYANKRMVNQTGQIIKNPNAPNDIRTNPPTTWWTNRRTNGRIAKERKIQAPTQSTNTNQDGTIKQTSKTNRRQTKRKFKQTHRTTTTLEDTYANARTINQTHTEEMQTTHCRNWVT